MELETTLQSHGKNLFLEFVFKLPCLCKFSILVSIAS